MEEIGPFQEQKVQAFPQKSGKIKSVDLSVEDIGLFQEQKWKLFPT